jgi:hypothetical protein
MSHKICGQDDLLMAAELGSQLTTGSVVFHPIGRME